MLSRCMPFTRSLMIWPPGWSGRSPAQKEEPVEGRSHRVGHLSDPLVFGRVFSSFVHTNQWRMSVGVDGCHFMACFYYTLGFQGICCLTVQRGTGKTAPSRIKTTSWTNHNQPFNSQAAGSSRPCFLPGTTRNPNGAHQLFTTDACCLGFEPNLHWRISKSDKYSDSAQRNSQFCPFQGNPRGYSMSLIATSSRFFNRTYSTLRWPVHYQQQ